MALNVRKSFAIAAIASSLFFLSGCANEITDATTSTGVVAEASAATYAAGTYTAEGSYTNPGGTSSIAVELTIDGSGIITAVDVTPEATGGNSKQFQEQFANGISDEVVGKSIDELSVSKVAGSSLTSAGFNAAVEEIRSEATA